MIIILISIILTLIISFLWALISLKKEFKKVKNDNYKNISRNKNELIEGREIVLFERTKID